LFVVVEQLVYGGFEGIGDRSREALNGFCLSVPKLVVDDHVPVIRGDTPAFLGLFARLLGLIGGLVGGLAGGLAHSLL
jgi:hypothetical protein